MKRLYFITITFLFIPLLGFAADLTSLQDIDMISLRAYMKDGVVRVKIIYRNRDEDKLVFWRKGTISCYYAIYENVGNSLRPKKGEEILSGSKDLNRFRQDFYIDMPAQYMGPDKRAIIECTVNTGYDTLTARDGFSLRPGF